MYMKKSLLTIAAVMLCGSAWTVPVQAETISGKLEQAASDSIVGWAWDSEDFDHIVDIELHITSDAAPQNKTILTCTADEYREDLHITIQDGWHGFSHSINWDNLEGDSFTITAFVITEENRTQLPETLTYTKIPIVEAHPSTEVQTAVEAPAVSISEAEAPKAEAMTPEPTAKKSSKPSDYGPGVVAANSVSGKKGSSLGIFKTTGYCNCNNCSNGHTLTYSGTVPTAKHTIAADIGTLPLGTKVMIDDIIYTVEDIGSSVSDREIDIYYSSHQEAWNHGVQDKEVFLVE